MVKGQCGRGKGRDERAREKRIGEEANKDTRRRGEEIRRKKRMPLADLRALNWLRPRINDRRKEPPKRSVSSGVRLSF